MIYFYFSLILWLVIGYGAVGYILYREYEKGKGITLNRLTGMFFIGLFGALVPFCYFLNRLFDFYHEHGDDVIIRKEGG
jgi:RsiW-degrading membrane proteinase PrsW (M82 family)